MSHFPRLLCPLCFVLETMACDTEQGLPPCECPAGGHGPCRESVCLKCLHKEGS